MSGLRGSRVALCLAATAAVLLSTRAAGRAAGPKGGGGHAAGGARPAGAASFSGGRSVGGPHGSPYGGGYYGGRYGGYYGYPYYHHHYYPYGYPLAFGLGIGLYSPLAYGTFYYPDYYPAPYGAGAYPYAAPPADAYGAPLGGYPVPADQGYPTTPASGDMAVRVDVRVPVADAEVFFDGTKTNQTGMTRYFESPPLDSGSAYEYTIRARWMEDGKPVTQTRKVTVFAGQRVGVNFGTPAARSPR